MHLFYPLCKWVSNTPIELMKPTHKATIIISFSEACSFDDNETGDIVICLILFLHQKQTKTLDQMLTSLVNKTPLLSLRLPCLFLGVLSNQLGYPVIPNWSQ